MTQLTLDITPEKAAHQKPLHTGQNGYDHYRRTFIHLFAEPRVIITGTSCSAIL
ncbi:TPA: hypothetical protein N2F56_004335 [Salmonella enterica]|nr:hypothetical protein [Salmonella enterica]HCL5083786.1 hypothetical protein [Salmonella enterica]